MQGKITHSDHIAKYRSNAKLLVSGEYLVLKGALALAFPLNVGQDLTVVQTNSRYVNWLSTENEKHWLNAKFSLPDLNILEADNLSIAKKLQQILNFAKTLNPDFLCTTNGIDAKANVGFNIEWGLGSSSTLVSNIALWAQCNPFELNRLAFGGSGYDIACATSASPVLFQLKEEKPVYENVKVNWPFIDQLYLVWLNKKQISSKEVKRFDQINVDESKIELASKITKKMIDCELLSEFVELMEMHEDLVSQIIQSPKVKQGLFSDFDGAIKSLGAWGGDFVLVASDNSFHVVKNYFKQKGFNTVLSFKSMIL
ncbi:MAG TPA: GYDIA family GHMP kinase [Prolixibacteraceae bacterium]|nr:GYDIA family GHMP kinase [Prolixibacteraceae bacterium]